MGLIKAGMGALGGTFADQWKEFFYCESMPKEVLVTKGQKRVTGRSAAGTAGRRMEVQLRKLCYRQVLSGMRKQETGTTAGTGCMEM